MMGFLGSGRPAVAFCSAFHLDWAKSEETLPFKPGVVAGEGWPGEGSASFKTCAKSQIFKCWTFARCSSLQDDRRIPRLYSHLS